MLDVVRLTTRPKPDFHPQRPIIIGVDEGLDSPETATLKYEEAAARANGGGHVRGDSPPGLLPMSFGKPPQTQLQGESLSQPCICTYSFWSSSSETAEIAAL